MVLRLGSFILLLFVFCHGNAQNVGEESYPLLKEAQRAVNEGKSIDAEKIINRIIDLPDNKQYYAIKGQAHRLMASICASHSWKPEEIEHLFKSYWYFQKTGDTKEEAEAQRLIGHYYTHMYLFDEADKYLTQAFKGASVISDTVTLIKIISDRAQLASALDQPDSALNLYEQAILFSEKIDFRKGLLENWNRMANTYWKTGDPQNMLLCMKIAVRYKIDNTDTLGIIYGDLGLAYMENQKLDSADFYLHKGIELIRKGHDQQQEVILLKYISDLRQKQERYAEALDLLNEHILLHKKVFSDQLKNEIGYGQSKYKQLEANSQLEENISRNRKIMIVAIVVALLLLMMAMFILWLRNNNSFIRKQKDELNVAFNQVKQSEELYKQVFEKNLGLGITHDFEGIILSANDAILKLLKLKKNDMIGRSVGDFIHNDHKHLFPDYLKEIYDKNQSTGLLAVVDADGKKKILRYQNNIASNANGEHFVIGFSQDQTDFFNAQYMANKTGKRLSVIMEHTPDTLAILKKDGHIKYINHGGYFNNDELSAKNILELLSGEQADRFSKNLKLVYSNKNPIQFQEEFRSRYLLIKLVPIVDGKDAKEVLAVITDITKSKESEAELNRLSSIVQQSNEGVLITDIDEKVIWINKGFIKITGYHRKEIIGKNPREVLKCPATMQSTVEFMSKQVALRLPFTSEVINYHKNGSEYWVKLIAQPIFDGSGVFQGYFFIQHDVTHEKEMIAQIIEAKEEAEESNRLKTIFLGSLSHEVRTPLQGILGFAEILETSVLSEDKRLEYLGVIKRRTVDMQNIIEALLDMASLETGEIKAFPIEINLYESVETAFNKTLQDSDFKDKPIELKLENNLKANTSVLIDPQHLLQVLSNLLGNAIKFTEEGTIKLLCEKQASSFQISVIDTGIGIASDNIEHIFKPFRQAHEGISRSKGGIGLGLSICKKMVELWGGTIEISSEIGKGSTFSFNIPNTRKSI
jgi:PAS domain S-box-containing protein